MDFFEAQEHARKKTKVLILYFVLAVVGIISAIYVLLVVLLAFTGEPDGAYGGEVVSWWQPTLLLAAALGSLTVIVTGSGFKIFQLASGGAKVAQALGGRRLSTDTTDPDERRLLNVVEEMAIASGTPVPDVYLLEHEEGINAFAAGYSPSDAVIGVTRGCMQLLSRDELQGVVAHEFSHVLNGDMRLNIRLMGILFGIVMLTVLGRIILRSGAYAGSSNRKGNSQAAIMLFGVGLLVIGAIGVFFARMIQAAVSRQREFLADASAVQFTRLPDGIAGALKKIGGLTQGSRLEDPHAEEASHMFFADGMVRHLGSALATHPPLPARIRAIQPHWDGTFQAPELTGHGRSEPRRTEPSPARPMPGAGQPALGFAAAAEMAGPPPRVQEAVPAFREPDDAQMAHAATLRSALPKSWLQQVRQSFGAQTALLGLLLSNDAELRNRQVQQLRGVAPEPLVDASLNSHQEMAGVSSEQKLALIDLAIPALRRLSPSEYTSFVRAMRLIVESDQKVSLFEFTLEKVLQRHLDLYFHRRPQPSAKYKSVQQVANAVEVLLSALAKVGANGDANAATKAFLAGASALKRHEPKLNVSLAADAQCGLQAVGQALDRLDQAGPLVKRAVLEACERVVLADGQVLCQELELIRAIADSLGAPLPVRVEPRGHRAHAASPA